MLLRPDKIPTVMIPVMGFPVLEKHVCTGDSPAKGLRDKGMEHL